ncbi:conserved protein of unknown function [Alteromonas macleodii]|uniref:Uncharacterized protein n=1 Tax=Alteromonas macleodii TaxID=28108 RepID=A0A6T9Y6B2_ALTMA|nr:conserved protein of unknown function [Alteromonas macleodii]
MDITLTDPAIPLFHFEVIRNVSIVAAFLSVVVGLIYKVKYDTALSLYKIILFSPVVPILCTYYGYKQYLDVFYAFHNKGSGTIELHFVYPANKRIVLDNPKSTFDPDGRSQTCRLVFRKNGEKYSSASANDVSMCKQISRSL